MWAKKRLTLSGDVSSIICSILVAHPWTPGAGKKESSGHYLSPENAISWTAGKLAGAPSDLDVTAMLLTAPSLTSFAAVLATAAEVFPLAQLTQTWRRASAAMTLETSKMQLPASMGGLPAASALSVPTLRQATAAQAVITAGSAAGGDLSGTLAAFREQRASLLTSAQKQLQELTGATLDVWTVSAIRNTAGAVQEMRDGIPDPDHVFSLCLVFAGEDLSELRGMLKDGR